MENIAATRIAQTKHIGILKGITNHKDSNISNFFNYLVWVLLWLTQDYTRFIIRLTILRSNAKIETH